MSEEEKQSGRYIPADIQRQVLIESGHFCAIPTCQYPATEFSHIEPFRKVKKHEATNIIALCPNHHTEYDKKKSIDKKSMRIYKQKLQFLHSRYTKYELRLLAWLSQKKFALASGEIQCMGLLKDGLIINIKSAQTYTARIAKNNTIYKIVDIAFFVAELTEKGTKFIENWKTDDEELMSSL